MDAGEPLILPRYGTGSLADVTPSLLAALGVEVFDDVFDLPPIDCVCLLIVDGLGWKLLRVASDAAPFLNAVADGREGTGRAITAGFPATTTTSLGSIGTGLPPGEHGLVGYTFAVPGFDGIFNALTWSLYGRASKGQLENQVRPEQLQPTPTVAEVGTEHGIRVERVGPEHLQRTPLSRAVFRGEQGYSSSHSIGDLASVATSRLGAGPSLVLAYYPHLDTTGHVRGVGSDSLVLELGHIDRLAHDIAERLPPRAALVITGDHGMVDIPDEGKIDLADHTDLTVDVRMVGGEARARHVYAEPGAAKDVLDAWRARLGDLAWIGTRDEAIEEGWFGRVTDDVRPRIGDVIMAAHGPVGVFQREVDPLQASLRGHHGSLTDGEVLVPFLIVGP